MDGDGGQEGQSIQGEVSPELPQSVDHPTLEAGETGEAVVAGGVEAAVDEAVQAGQPENAARGALEAVAAELAPVFASHQLLAVRRELNLFLRSGKISEKVYRQAISLLQEEAKKQNLRSLGEQADFLANQGDNPFGQALGYDLKISALSQKIADLDEGSEKGELRRQRDELLEKQKNIKDEDNRAIAPGQAVGEFYTFLTGELKSEISFADVEESIADLVSDPEKASKFMQRALADLPEGEDADFEPLFEAITNFNPANEANKLASKVKKKEAAERVKVTGGLLALFAVFMVWRAKKTNEAGQGR